MENQKEEMCRIVTLISKEEKDLLLALANKNLRSMSSFMRLLLIKEIDEYSEI
ncbi:MAG TPA: hypothetical protein PLP16_09715 [Smithellaceae bacterium]|nr:hypothetical protein [Smithellaceae bacterium]